MSRGHNRRPYGRYFRPSLAQEQIDALIKSQHDLQLHHYLTQYPHQDYQLVLLQGEPVGRLLLSRMPDELRIVDISLLASIRGKGLGSKLINHALQLARQYRLPLTLHVDVGNPAYQLYRKLGFEVIALSGTKYLMIKNTSNKRRTALDGKASDYNTIGTFKDWRKQMIEESTPSLSTTDSPIKRQWEAPSIYVLGSQSTQGKPGASATETTTFSTNGPS